MSKRSFVCLRCGQKHIVEQEVYQTIRSNPICEHCRQISRELPPEAEPKQDDSLLANVSSLAYLLKQGIDRVGREGRMVSDAPTLDDAPVNPGNIGSTWSAPGDSTWKPTTDVGQRLYNSISSLKNQASEALHWQHIGCLGDIYDKHREILSRYSNYVGLYMHKINGQIMYIGRAVEYNNGGFRKRLSDYCRDSDSARKHPSGQKIYANRYRIQTYLMVVGSDRLAAEKTKLLEKQYVALYNPPWNEKLKEL